MKILTRAVAPHTNPAQPTDTPMNAANLPSIESRLATELLVREEQISATVALLDEGATVPFIARYRKEITGGLDDTQLRLLAERLDYLRELDSRRLTILKSIGEQEKLTPELEQAIYAAQNKTTLEDLYLPFKPKRRTKAMIAREAGLQGLADALLADPSQAPETLAASYFNEQITDTKAALDGARAILIETFAEDATVIGTLREQLWQTATLTSQVVAGQENTGEKFRDYFEHSEPLKNSPSHRVLALLRGRNEGILSVSIHYQPKETPATQASDFERQIAQQFNIADQGRAADAWLLQTVALAWRSKIFVSLELELLGRLKESADAAAIQVFAANLQDVLLAAPAGARPTLGLDPGIRTGVKVAVVDATGKVLDTAVVYPHEPRQDWQGALATLSKLCLKHQVALIAIGNGTASRETDKLAGELMQQVPQLGMQKIVVSEAGASVYSASELAAKEFPDMDVTLRGAVSIARRLQDPLAELVKIDPKSIGVGQYQHDLNQNALARSLDAVVEDCVNAVGVDVNMASAALLTRISGLNATLANNIVTYRNENGAFKNRTALKKVPRLGEKTFEQAAGFLRISGGSNPLDASGVHPEAYSVIKAIEQNTGRPLQSLIGDATFLKTLKPQDYLTETFGLPTVLDILKELEKPARDPRPEFKTATFQEGVSELRDLSVGMILEGVVSNVAAFGAFVDIGVHQDGLVHISALSKNYVGDPRTVVKAGDVVKVKVMEVDIARKRVALSMRLDDDPAQMASGNKRPSPANPTSKKPTSKAAPAKAVVNSAMADALAKLKR